MDIQYKQGESKVEALELSILKWWSSLHFDCEKSVLKPEREICRILNVDRTTWRFVMERLKTLGVAESRQGSKCEIDTKCFSCYRHIGLKLENNKEKIIDGFDMSELIKQKKGD